MSKFKVGDKPIIVERYADNGEHSHWELIDVMGNILWSEDDSTTIAKTSEKEILITQGIISDPEFIYTPPTPAEQWQNEAEEMYPQPYTNGGCTFSYSALQSHRFRAHIKARELAHSEQQQRDREIQGQLDELIQKAHARGSVMITRTEVKALWWIIENRLRSLTSLPTEQSDTTKK